MTVTTHTNVSGQTVVKVRQGLDWIVIQFKTRQDALALLKALRKRAR